MFTSFFFFLSFPLEMCSHRAQLINSLCAVWLNLKWIWAATKAAYYWEQPSNSHFSLCLILCMFVPLSQRLTESHRKPLSAAWEQCERCRK